MPAIVIGADAPLGRAIARRMLRRPGEIRAFVTDPTVGSELKAGGAKVAVGDVTDASHVGAAAMGCFTVVVVDEAAIDERERSFAPDPAAAHATWREALLEASPRRLIWVGTPLVEIDDLAPEIAVVGADGDPHAIAERVAALDDAASI